MKGNRESTLEKDCAHIAELFGLCCDSSANLVETIVGNRPIHESKLAVEFFDRSSLLTEANIVNVLSCFRPVVIKTMATNPSLCHESTYKGENAHTYIKMIKFIWQAAFSSLKRTLFAPKCLIVSEHALAKAFTEIEHLYLHGESRYSPSDIKKSFDAFLKSLPDLATAIARHDYANPLGDISSITSSPKTESGRMVAAMLLKRELDRRSGVLSPLDITDDIMAKMRETPLATRVVELDKSAAKSFRDTMKDPGGRPSKTHGGAKVMTQKEMAVAFGEPCNAQMVANWEARAAGKKRGANPPDAIYKDEKIIYTSELRLNPTPDNKNRLSALIVEFQSRHRLKDDVGRKALHMKSPETLARMQGVIQKETRKLHQNP